MQPVRLKRRDEERAVAPASSPQAGLGQSPRRRGFGSGGSSRGRGGLLPWSIAIAACLAAGATGYLLYREKGRVAALEQEQAFLQSSYDEKLKALQRRLVGAIMAQGASPCWSRSRPCCKAAMTRN